MPKTVSFVMPAQAGIQGLLLVNASEIRSQREGGRRTGEDVDNCMTLPLLQCRERLGELLKYYYREAA